MYHLKIYSLQKKEYKNENIWFHKYNNFSINFFSSLFQCYSFTKNQYKINFTNFYTLGTIFHNFASVLYCFTSKSSYCGCCLLFAENG